jgi:uncharacterized protein YjbI with pentapeptide repeats
VGLALSDLTGVNFVGVDLQGANLTNAIGITNEELELQAQTPEWSLAGATMPNGRKYEDWIKDREDGKENA